MPAGSPDPMASAVPPAPTTARAAGGARRPGARRLRVPAGAGGHAATAAAVLAALLLPVPAVDTPDPDFAPPLLTLGGLWHAPAWAWALSLGLALPLVLRHRAPLAVFGLGAAVAFVQWLAGPPLYADLVLLVSLYGVIAHLRDRRAVAVALGVAFVGLAFAVARWGNGSIASAISLTAMLATAVAFGLLARSRSRAIAVTRERAVQTERSRIAREMHDVVTHNLSVMVALADGARLTMAGDPVAARSAVDDIARTGREGLRDMRRLLGALHDDREAAPLAPAPGIDELEPLVASVRRTGLRVELDRSAGATLSAGEALTTYRVVQEALTNVLRHAPRAAHVTVTLGASADGAVEVVIADDGGPANGQPRLGSGLTGMAERVALHGGRLEAGPSDSGWRVVAHLPGSDADRA